MSKTLEEAVEIAREAMSRDDQIVRPEFRGAYIITSGKPCPDGSGAFRVRSESAWTPQTRSLLPWSAPTGKRLARVNRDGTIEHLEG